MFNKSSLCWTSERTGLCNMASMARMHGTQNAVHTCTHEKGAVQSNRGKGATMRYKHERKTGTQNTRSLVCWDEVAGLLVSKFHLVSQDVDVQQLPHVLLAVVGCGNTRNGRLQHASALYAALQAYSQRHVGTARGKLREKAAQMPPASRSSRSNAPCPAGCMLICSPTCRAC